MKVLKTVLWICAVCCFLGFLFAALPWRALSALFHWVGVQPPTADPITVFMLRLSLATFGMIGIFFAILARNPLKYGAMLLLAAYGLVCYGVFCLLGGLRYGLPVWTYGGDVIFGVVAGILLVIFRKKAIESSTAQQSG